MKILKLLFYVLGITFLPYNAFAVVDDIYYNSKDADKDAEEEAARAEKLAKEREEAQKKAQYQTMVLKTKQQQNVRVDDDTIFIEDPSIAGGEFYTDTVMVEKGDDYTYTDRLNRFHDAGIPMYTVEEVEGSDSPTTTTVYINSYPYYYGYYWGRPYYVGYYS